MKTSEQNPSAGVSGKTQGTLSTKGGHVGALACKALRRLQTHCEQGTITWSATSVTLTHSQGTTIAIDDKPTEHHSWYDPRKADHPR